MSEKICNFQKWHLKVIQLKETLINFFTPESQRNRWDCSTEIFEHIVDPDHFFKDKFGNIGNQDVIGDNWLPPGLEYMLDTVEESWPIQDWSIPSNQNEAEPSELQGPRFI